jgi:hypothetical protein
MDTIKEYTIMQICSELQAAPKMDKIFGFDLIVTPRFIYFAM